MRIVLDTNVLVSGLLNPDGPPGRIVDLILDGRLQVLYDDRILGEYLDVLERPRLAILPEQARAIITYLRLAGERITAQPLPTSTLPDPDDLMFAEIAITGKADALVSGNIRHYSGLDQYGVRVLSPLELLQSLT